ncbi:insulinase family protein [Salegentibacter sp. BLCTC]|uniref:M16 family metallopeptidase n=1 Tax=Salegentibacter sp. BLCTC TaxID=2697368 RepID=UPI00187B951F|nr:pitrilysin family protein [Salegentibacter sp. BLCTC]MBE7640075.1 insulinase family protein [Salegentibacter sp. BLCTC]
MKQGFFRICTYIFLFSFFTSYAQESKFQHLKSLGGIEEYNYKPNDLQVLLYQDQAAPVVTVQITYHVGSKHEVPGNTGSTHLLEHLMFKGTPKYNPETITVTNVLQNIGANLNATTWNDRTNYYETIPSDYLELAIEVEADRMRNALLLPEDKEAEMTVVRNEFEQGENNPNSILSKEIWATAFMAHPYHHSTIGWKSDIENAPNEKLREFYDTYYWPNNATLSIIGDFEKEEVFELVDKYFGQIAKAPHEFPQPYTEEPEQTGPRQITVKKPGQTGVVMTAFKVPGRMHEDHAALGVLNMVLTNGASAILNKKFTDNGKALYAYSQLSNFKDHNLMSIGLGLAPDFGHEEAKKEIRSLVDSIKTNSVAQEAINRVVSATVANNKMSRDGSFAIAGALNEAIAVGDWTDYINRVEKLKQVTPEDVKRVANKYLNIDQSTTGFFIPKNKTAGNEQAENKAEAFQEGYNNHLYYRNPKTAQKEQTNATNLDFTPGKKKEAFKYKRQQVKGIDLVTVKTAVNDFITVTGSFNAGEASTEKSNLASITAAMLSKGTATKDKYEFSAALEKMGTNISFYSGDFKTGFYFKTLNSNANSVIQLLAEALYEPAFKEDELELLKKQYVGNLKNRLDDPGTLAQIELLQTIYPENHPNYSKSLEAQIKDIESITLKDVKAFHKANYIDTPIQMVIVGDVNETGTISALKESFPASAKKGTALNYPAKAVKNKKEITKTIQVPEKPSATLTIAQYTGLTKNDPDYLAMKLGTYALGGGFAGRLMQEVRDKEGLTYGIYANQSSNTFTDGYWLVNASFNPGLIEKGEESSFREINKWIKNGITKEELQNKKTNIVGSFKVSLSTTGGMANTILTYLQEGKDPSYIATYPKEIEKLSLKEVNKAIKKYIKPEQFIIIKSGSFKE